jgi:hypothetical protein
MGKVFEGCVQAREISLTRKAANPHAVVLVRKNAAGEAPSQTQTENTDMATEAEVQKAAAAMAVAIVAKTALWNDVTRAHFAALPADAHEVFLAKSAVEQNGEAEVAKAAADTAEAEKAAAAAGKTAREVDLEKRLNSQDEVIKGLQAKQADAEIEKRASAEFAGFPGGVQAAVETLKSAKTLRDAGDAAGADRVEGLMKSQIELARSGVARTGLRTDQDTTKSAAARARIETEATKRAEAGKVSIADARVAVYEDAAFAEDVRLIESGE